MPFSPGFGANPRGDGDGDPTKAAAAPPPASPSNDADDDVGDDRAGVYGTPEARAACAEFFLLLLPPPRLPSCWAMMPYLMSQPAGRSTPVST